jgi:hypothetical protein
VSRTASCWSAIIPASRTSPTGCAVWARRSSGPALRASSRPGRLPSSSSMSRTGPRWMRKRGA